MLGVQVHNLNLSASADSMASVNSDTGTVVNVQVPEVVVGPTNFMDTTEYAEFLAYKQEKKRTREDGDQGGKAKKPRPLMAPKADGLYKKARNSMGKQQKFKAMSVGLNKFKEFGSHLVPNIFKIRDIIPNGTSDQTLIQRVKNAIKACEREFLEAYMDHAERMYEIHDKIAKESLAELEKELENTSTKLEDVKKAADKCAEYHRVKEHGKQQKMWAAALSLKEAEDLGVKPPKKEGKKPPNKTQGQGRTIKKAKRRIPKKKDGNPKEGNSNTPQPGSNGNQGANENVSMAIKLLMQANNQ